MGDCSEAGRSGGIILTPAPFCGHCSSRCGSHGPALMIPRASGGCEPLITFCLARAQSIVIYAALYGAPYSKKIVGPPPRDGVRPLAFFRVAIVQGSS